MVGVGDEALVVADVPEGGVGDGSIDAEGGVICGDGEVDPEVDIEEEERGKEAFAIGVDDVFCVVFG